MEFRRVLFRSDADLLEQVAADVAPLVAAHAAEALEQVIAALLGRRDGIVAAAQVLVEACIGGDQRAVERSEEHTSELQSLMRISYAVFCLKKKKKTHTH